ncbi:unnamed protein product [Durusdinium trenchii]|uniref:Protein kinase domain-containing protein n=1 Tax=Durusdinium trenchii TaxID=1381693 RepID=A0ABP0IRJ5_9DINO
MLWHSGEGEGISYMVSCVFHDCQSALRNYTIIKELGEGKFGQVKEVLRTGTKQRFAWKQVTSEKDPYYKVELEILGNLEHEGIIGVVEAYTQEGVVDMVLELCKISLQGGKKQYVRPSSWDIASTMLQIFSAVAFLHESQVAHRDIKPDNVLLSTGERWKLADFGLASRFKSGSYMEEVVGTQPFKAPEVEKGYYTEKCDVYSTGVLFIALATGKEWWRPESVSETTKPCPRPTTCRGRVKRGMKRVFRHVSPGHGCRHVGSERHVSPACRHQMKIGWE